MNSKLRAISTKPRNIAGCSSPSAISSFQYDGHILPELQTRTRVKKGDGRRPRACAAAARYLDFVAQTRMLRHSGSLERAEGHLEHLAKNSDGGSAIQCLNASSQLWIDRSGAVLFGLFELVVESSIGTAIVGLGATMGARCAMVCRRGCGYCPGRRSSRLTKYRLGRRHRQSSSSQ